MEERQTFETYYDLLQVNPRCDARVLEIAFHHLAKVYHPDNKATADNDKFNLLVEAYTVLRDPAKREEYDRQHLGPDNDSGLKDRLPDESRIEEQDALRDGEAHEKILLMLYRKRRENAGDAGVIPYYIQTALECSDANFDFHVWYLKSKGFLTVTEQGTLAITIEGVDHVIGNSRAAKAEQLQLTKSLATDTDGQPPSDEEPRAATG